MATLTGIGQILGNLVGPHLYGLGTDAASNVGPALPLLVVSALLLLGALLVAMAGRCLGRRRGNGSVELEVRQTGAGKDAVSENKLRDEDTCVHDYDYGIRNRSYLGPLLPKRLDKEP
jgi:hypothetical protein